MIAFALRYHRPLIAVALLLALMWALNRYVANAVHDDRVETRNAALEADSKADDAAGQVAAAKASTIAQENDDARKAALDSDDPLRAGFDRLRAGKGRDGEAASHPADVRR